jgi:membrane protease YdiL (CAAX protease family)
MNPLLFVAALGLGLVWGWLYAATDDLLLSAACHLAWDALMLFGPAVL